MNTPPPPVLHRLPAVYAERPLKVVVVGCGGTGSQLLPGLARLHRTMIALGHPGGLHVTVYDDDDVATHNCVRQNFFEPDVGVNKAEVMTYRLNVAHAGAGLRWESRPTRFAAHGDDWWRTDIVIGCVDTRASRREIARAMDSTRHCYWIDCGNSAHDGQVIVGEGGSDVPSDRPRLPLPSVLLPEIVSGEDDSAPSCSAVESILRQGVVTNQMCATWALAWLAEALGKGEIAWNGVFFNLVTGRVSPIAADPAVWARMGYSAPVVKRRRKRTAA